MYTYPESMTVVARYLLPELDESACCLHCRQKLHVVNPVAVHRLCGIVLCESCFSKALIDYHSSPLVGRMPPGCPSCRHSLTEENSNLTLPPLRWRMELARQQEQQSQSFSNSYGFGTVYEPVLFGGKNAVGEEFVVLPDGTGVRANPVPQPMNCLQLEQQLKDLDKFTKEKVEELSKGRSNKDSSSGNRSGNNSNQSGNGDNNGNQNQGNNNWQGQKGNGKNGRQGNYNNNNYNNNNNNNNNNNHNKNRNQKGRGSNWRN